MKSILITGAAGNLGQAVVKRFAQDGYQVYTALGLGQNSSLFEKSPLAAQIHPQLLDLTDETVSEAYVKKIIAQDPALEAAVCLVGGWHSGTLAETRGAELEKMIQLNFMTAFNIVRPLMEYFERRGSGQFVLIGSRPAIKPAEAKDQVAYALSKSLVFRLAEIINDQGKSKSIRASVIVPSILDTPQNRAAMPDASAEKWVQPEAVADTIAFLLGETGGNFRETIVKVYNQA